MARDESIPEPAFRLCGEVEGIFRSFPLTRPVIRLGTHPGNDVVLPISGVSRNHAVLTTDAGGLTVEDRGSKNGTRVNGVRVARTRLAAGDELTVGNATLRLEAVAPEAARLALTFDSGFPLESASKAESVETDRLESVAAVSTAARLRWIESFVDRRARPETGLAEALDDLNQRLGSVAIGVVSWHPDTENSWHDPAILGVAGDVEVFGRGLDRHRTLLGRARDRACDAGWQLEVVGGVELVAGLSPIGAGGVVALMISGDFPGRSTCGPWLRLLCRLVEVFEHLEDASVSPEQPTTSPRLSFPNGFVAGRSAAAQGLYRELEMACGGDYPVLILGETGSGKELVARTLHRSSRRSEKPFVAVNCAAIPADLLEAEMFGVARGAATGVAPRAGCFQRASGGTLFLDEIGEMQPELQAKLLRVLECGEMQPVGGSPLRVDVRVLSATNALVEKRITDGGFRADLYYRLAATIVTVPALRQRPDDLPALVQHFVHLYCEELGIRLRGLSQDALELLVAYPWPGNVRELQHMLRRAVQAAFPGQVLDAALLPAKLREGPWGRSASAIEPHADMASHAGDGGSLDLRERVAEVETRVIREALARTGGHRILTAKLLGISRNTLASKMNLHGLSSP